MGIVLICLLVQVIVITIIVVILKIALDKKLIELAMRQLEFLKADNAPGAATRISIISCPALATPYKDQMTQIIKKQCGASTIVDFLVDKKIMGGVVIKRGEQVIDCSVKNRLQQAFGGKAAS